MLVVFRFDGHAEGSLLALVQEALEALGRQPGFRWGCAGRSPDNPGQWVLTSLWEGIGPMRRGLGSYDAKLALGPLQQFSAEGSGTYEVLAEHVEGSLRQASSERAADADVAGPGTPP